MPALFKYRHLITLFLLAAVLVSGASAATYEADTTANFTTNLSAAPTGSTIIITGDGIIVSNASIDKIITIKSDGTPRTLTAASGKRLFYINSTGDLTLGDGVNLTGGYADYAGGVYVNGGKFTMNGGNITDNSARYGGGVCLYFGGTFNMTGGKITNNSADYGGGMYVNSATFNMTGGKITDNRAIINGGGVHVYSGTFNMTGGTIANNLAFIGGGVSSMGTFNMTAGTITKNTADHGGGMYVNSATLNMTGGKITDNRATINGGGVYLEDHGTFTMTAGTITNNTAEHGGGVYVVDLSTFTMTAGTITNNTATNYGGGMWLGGGVTFTMNGSATVNINNDVYLDSSDVNNITVVGLLTANAGALNITPGYTTGTVAHYNDVIWLGTWANNFALNITWATENGRGLKQSGNDIILEIKTTPTATPTGTPTETPTATPTSVPTSSGGNDANDPAPVIPATSAPTVSPTETPAVTSEPTVSPVIITTTNTGEMIGTFTLTGSPLMQVSIAGDITPNAAIVVTLGLPNGVQPAPGVEYQSFEITTDGISSDALGTMTFSIPLDELARAGFGTQDVALWHYADGIWTQLPTYLSYTENGNAVYISMTNGYSPFAITYAEGATSAGSIPESNLIKTQVPTEIPTNVPTSAPTETAASPLPIIGIVAGLCIAIGFRVKNT